MLDTSSHLYYNVSDFTVADAEGLYVRDEDGNEFMDCSAGTFNLSLGYRHPAVVQAIKDQADKLIHVSSSYQTHPINEMTSMLAELAPAGLKTMCTRRSPVDPLRTRARSRWPSASPVAPR